MKAAIKSTHSHHDRLNQPVAVDSIVAFSYSGGKRVHIGRVTRITPRRVRIRYSYEYYSVTGQAWTGLMDYQADPATIVVLNGIEQQLTVLALRGLL